MIGFDSLGRVGRLGNSLYQLASTIGVARERGEHPSFNEDWPYRPWFSIPDEFFTGGKGTPVTDLVPHLDPRERVYLQDCSLFTSCLGEIRRYLAPSLAALLTLVDQTAFGLLPRPVLAVHVRRGDNVPGQDVDTPDKHLWHPMPPSAYYERAIELLQPDAGSVAVFSDEPAWCREHLPGADYYHEGVVRPKEHMPGYATAPILDWIDWFLLASCDAHVLSNSTFGMFAAIVADSKTVVYPWPLYGPNLSYIDGSRVVLPHWVKLEVASC